jgi:hypothetical protein
MITNCEDQTKRKNLYYSGISKLASLSEVKIRQKTTVFSGNKYVVMEPGGEPVLRAKEAGVGLLGGKARPFEIGIFDMDDQEVRTFVFTLVAKENSALRNSLFNNF